MNNGIENLNEMILKRKALQLLRLTKRLYPDGRPNTDELIKYLDAVIDDYCERLKKQEHDIKKKKMEHLRKCQSDYEKYKTLLFDIDVQIAEIKSKLKATKKLYNKYNPIQRGILKIKGYRISDNDNEDEDDYEDE